MKIDSKKYKRRFVIADVHACLKTLRNLIENKIELTKDDALFLLGDYIDRGPNSSGTLDYLMQIQQEYNVFALRGNHEHDLLKSVERWDIATLFMFHKRNYKSHDLLDSKTGLKPQYKAYMETLPFYFELEDFILTHAGFELLPNGEPNLKVNLYSRHCVNNPEFTGGKTIIHGHDYINLIDIQKAVNRKADCIPLDNGCVYSVPNGNYDSSQLGNLLALNLDTYELIIQPNIDG